jgi:uncharacterized membrane protein (UPF0127 family)
MHVPRSTASSLLGLVLALAACTSSDAPPTAQTGTTSYIPTPSPASSVTPGPPPSTPGEPVASTATIPVERLPLAEFLRASGASADLPRLAIEVLPAGEFSIGLSGRRTLGERGMLFDYGAAGQQGPFWMKNTHIDLDIAFIDENLRIVSIRTMRAESEEYVHSAAPYQSAIEAPPGWYAAHGVRVGDRVRYVPPGVPPTP